MATRDSNSIRSHAQKHFIKMYRDQIPLPAKVLESGDGYTLSGKPLDPNSAAAKPYLSRGGSISGPSVAPKAASERVEKAMEKNDPMEGVVAEQDDKKVQEDKSEGKQEKKEERAMEADTITKTVESQTKELSIGEGDKKKTIVEKNKKKANSKSATPSPTNSST